MRRTHLRLDRLGQLGRHGQVLDRACLADERVQLACVQASVNGKVVGRRVDGLIGRQRLDVAELGLDEHERVVGRALPQLDEVARVAEAQRRMRGEHDARLTPLLVESRVRQARVHAHLVAVELLEGRIGRVHGRLPLGAHPLGVDVGVGERLLGRARYDVDGRRGDGRRLVAQVVLQTLDELVELARRQDGHQHAALALQRVHARLAKLGVHVLGLARALRQFEIDIYVLYR